MGGDQEFFAKAWYSTPAAATVMIIFNVLFRYIPFYISFKVNVNIFLCDKAASTLLFIEKV